MTPIHAVDDNLITKIVRRIAAAARPRKVILFGGRARRGAPTATDRRRSPSGGTFRRRS